jgi:pilus assembly protein CpaB
LWKDFRERFTKGRTVSVSIRAVATLAVAVCLGFFAVLLTQRYLSNATQSGRTVTATTGSIPVVVASQPLDRGVVLQPNFLRVVNFPADAFPANAFRAVSELTGGKEQQRLVLRSMVANEPVLASNISGPGGKLNLSGTIAAGMRAVSLRSGDVAGVGGFVLPGDRVDVLLTRSTGTNNAETTLTQVLAENVRVLGVDQSDNDQADKPVVSKAITVEVTPDQAQSISLAQTVGTVSLALRHVADDTPLTRKSMAVSDLGPGPRKAAGPPAAPAVRVVRGTDASRFTFGVAGALERTAAKVPAGVIAP